MGCLWAKSRMVMKLRSYIFICCLFLWMCIVYMFVYIIYMHWKFVFYAIDLFVNVVLPRKVTPATCQETVVGGKQGYFPCEIHLSNKSYLCVSHISCRSYDYHKFEVTLATPSLWDITGFKTVVSVCMVSSSSSRKVQLQKSEDKRTALVAGMWGRNKT